MDRTILSSNISKHLREYGRKWSIAGKEKYPWPEEILETLDKMDDRLDTEPRYTSIELGGIMLKDNEHGRGVYLYLGDLNDGS